MHSPLPASATRHDAPIPRESTEATPRWPDNSLGMDSNALLQGRKCVTIVHNGMCYRLQSTKLGKLILTK